MSVETEYLAKVREIVRKDPRYTPDAYLFVHEALDFTVRKLEKPRHVSGQELLEGIRGFATDQFSALAPMVFRAWGIRRSEDFGEIVFNLVESGLMGKTENDTRDDFKNGYDFEEAFRVRRG